MKSACCLALLGLVLSVPVGAIWPSLLDRLTQRVDTLADRIDSGIHQAVNPMMEHISQNVRDTLGIWNRGPFGSLASGHPSPVAPPNSNPQTPSHGVSHNPFDLGLSPLFQSFFDSIPQKEWWKGPNVCIQRDEIDETKPSSNSTVDQPEVAQTAATSSDSSELVVEDAEEIDDDFEDTGRGHRSQFNAHVRMSSCKDEGLAYVCETKIRSNGIRKTYNTRYSCCHGTIREAGEFGCHSVELRPLQETVFALGGRSFLSLMKEAGIDSRIASDNFTFFVPVDRSAPSSADAVNDVNVHTIDADAEEDSGEEVRIRRQAATITRLDVEAQQNEMRTIVRSHFTRGIYLTPDFRDEQMLDSEDPDAKIRINLYNAPDRVYTANCVRLVSANHYSQQGVVHMLDGVMKPATKTIAQLLEAEPHFSSFRKLLIKSQNPNLLSQPGQLTVFAPTDDAFAKLDADVRERLMKGQGCVRSVVEQHMLPNVICSTVIQGRARSTTLLGSSILLERDLEGKLYVNGKQVITRDVMASNGVLHIIDGVLIPENARSFSQLLDGRNLTELARLVEAAGMTPILDSLTNATFFAPNNDAVRAVPDAVKQSWISNPEQLKQVLSYHLIQPAVRQPQLANNQLVETSHKGHSLRINFYQSMPFFNAVPLRATAQCASVIRWEQEACNGNVHVIDRVLMPPTYTITQWLANNRSFSIMSKLLKDTNLSAILDAEGPYTVLAPPDVAFYQMPEEQLSEMTKDPRKAAAILKQHILPEHLCCAGFRGDWFTSNRRRTFDGSWISLQRHLDGSLTAGDAHVSTCDQLATNGVIHIVDHVIVPKQAGLPGLLSGTRRLGLPGMELIFNGGK